MSLRQQIVLAFGLAVIISSAFLFFATRFILLESYLALEQQFAERNILRLENLLADDMEGLGRTVADWAYWNDAYDFATDGNPEYIENNLGNQTLLNLDINMMIYVNTAGQLIHGKYVDLITGEETAPPELTDILAFVQTLLQQNDLTASSTGFFQTSQGVVEFAARLILTNEQEGPAQGVLIMGRYMAEARIALLEKSLQLPIRACLPDECVSELDDEAVNQLLDRFAAPVIKTDDRQLLVYTPLEDIYGRTALIFQVSMTRDIYYQGLASMVFFYLFIALAGVVITLVTLLVLNRQVIQRILQLHQFVSTVRETDDLSRSLTVVGQDELAELTANLNQMVRALAESRHELQESYNQLEVRVAERTRELAELNTQLKQEVAEREQAQIELAYARDQAVDALRLKTQILANVSHDARTPLTVIMMNADTMLRAGTLDEKQQNKVNSILTNSQQLLSFFNNLLEEARSRSNQLKLYVRPFQITGLIESTEAIMLPLAKRKGLALQAEIDVNMPEIIEGDVDRVRQILTNLVDNAIKYTSEGSVRVRIFGSGGGQWTMAVSDTGRGIAEADQSHIFEAFWQVDGSVTRDVNRGVGLGLSIVKQLTALMGGTVQVKSAPGEGSTFVVTLPLKRRAGELHNETSCTDS